MEIRVSNDSIEVEGYVNAIERKSKPLWSRMGRFVERIKKGAFKRSIERNDDIRLLLNHDHTRDLGGVKDGNLTLVEDNIGLKAKAVITDAEVVEKGRRGELIGWSFGFVDVPNGVVRSIEDGMELREVNDLELHEVSILDRTKRPAYDGTLLTVRSDDEIEYHGEDMIPDEVQIREEEQPKQHENVEKNIDYSRFEEMIAQMKEGNNV